MLPPMGTLSFADAADSRAPLVQFTYFQQAGGRPLAVPAVEITYGLERILMSLQVCALNHAPAGSRPSYRLHTPSTLDAQIVRQLQSRLSEAATFSLSETATLSEQG